MTSEDEKAPDSPPSDGRISVPTTGTRIGHFILQKTLGEGGMGIVFDARDEDLQRDVAIKIIRTEDNEDAVRAGAKEQQRLLREAQAMALLSHPNLVTIYEVGTYGDDVFLVMEKVEGVTLQRWLSRNPPIEDIVEVFYQAAQALQAVHDAGLVHRDFKPANVVVTPDQRAKLLDLGIARKATELVGTEAIDRREAIKEAIEGGTLDSGELNMLDATLTRAGELVGTPEYMAPEQLLGQSVGPKSDQFSFGVALYEALTGERPFRGSTDLQLISNVVAGSRKPWPELAAIPEALQVAVDRALANKPEDRFASISWMAGACRDALGLRGRLKYLTQRWLEHGKDPTYLLTSRAMMADAEALLADPKVNLSAAQESFLQHSREANGRRRMSRRFMIGATGVLAGGLVVTGVSLYRSNRQIEDTVQSQIRTNVTSTRDMLARSFDQHASALRLLFEQRAMWLTNIARLERVVNYGPAAREGAVTRVLEDLNGYFAPVLDGLEQLAALRIASARFEYLLLDAQRMTEKEQVYSYYNRVVDIDAWGTSAFQLFTPEQKGAEAHSQWMVEGQFDRRGRLWSGYEPGKHLWFQAEQTSKDEKVCWTRPGLLYATQQPGVTGTIPWIHEGKRFVLAADFDLTDLSIMTSGMDAPNLWIVLLNDNGEVLGLPQQERFSSQEKVSRYFQWYSAKAAKTSPDASVDQPSSLPTLADLSLPELDAAYKASRASPDEVFRFTFENQKLHAGYAKAAANLSVMVVERPAAGMPV